MVLRTRTNVPEENIGPIASEVSRFLYRSFSNKSKYQYFTVINECMKNNLASKRFFFIYRKFLFYKLELYKQTPVSFP